jgi:hypothetical protein
MKKFCILFKKKILDPVFEWKKVHHFRSYKSKNRSLVKKLPQASHIMLC